MFGISLGIKPARRQSFAGHGRSVSVTSFNHDGMEIVRVRKERRWLPAWHLVFFVYMVMLVRLIAMADAGPAAYANRIAQLEAGTVLERAAAKVMYMDPVSRSIANEVRAGLRKFGTL